MTVGESQGSNELQHRAHHITWRFVGTNVKYYLFQPKYVLLALVTCDMWALVTVLWLSSRGNWTPWRLSHHRAPQRSHFSFPWKYPTRSAQMRHSLKQFFISLEFTLVWHPSSSDKLSESNCVRLEKWDRAYFSSKISWHLNRNFWQMYQFLGLTNPPPSLGLV